MRVCEDPTLNLFILGHFCPILNLQGCKIEDPNVDVRRTVALGNDAGNVVEASVKNPY